MTTAQTIPDRVQLVELEEKLRNDKGNHYKRELLDSLAKHNGDVGRLAQHGDWTPDEFGALELLKRAIEKASFILANVKLERSSV
jgi:hypothetical protein